MPGPLSGTWGYLSLEPSATQRVHEENSVIAEGLVPLRVPGLGFTGIGVLCFSCRPSESPGGTLTNEKKGKTK